MIAAIIILIGLIYGIPVVISNYVSDIKDEWKDKGPYEKWFRIKKDIISYNLYRVVSEKYKGEWLNEKEAIREFSKLIDFECISVEECNEIYNCPYSIESPPSCRREINKGWTNSSYARIDFDIDV